ncbi:alpha-farnesene synthase-like [Euphorbia lathyris]|uniref:alpha-farnesene synthase-like n=1 Tax=Euphorbia lathyris TaxID=212925 RepID=UPI0033139C1D
MATGDLPMLASPLHQCIWNMHGNGSEYDLCFWRPASNGLFTPSHSMVCWHAYWGALPTHDALRARDPLTTRLLTQVQFASPFPLAGRACQCCLADLVVVSHVFREGNQVADALANYGRLASDLQMWNTLPDFCSLLARDNALINGPLVTWWRNLDLIENMNFSRDRLLESFMCTVGLGFEPKYSNFRKWLTKLILMIIVIDDLYDIYGSWEELRIFTNAVQRWEIGGEVEHLPECMQICLEALYNMTNEMTLEIHAQKGLDYVPTQFHLKKVWGDFCESLLIEAKWFNKGHIPSLEEYLKNGWISSSGSLLSVHSFFCIMDRVTQETMDFLGRNQDLIHNISLIIRLCNDLGTSVAEQERGDAASSIICYMKDMNVSEEAAKTHIKGMINHLWKKINGKCFTNISTNDQMQLFLNISTNMARVAHNLYQNGDGFGGQGHEIKKQILSLLVHPLNLDH